MFAKETVILDCGVSHVALGVFRDHGGRLRLEQLAVEHFSSANDPDHNWLESVRVACVALRGGVKRGGPVALVLPPHLTLLKNIRVPPLAPAQRDRVIRFEAEHNLPCALAELAWDSVVCAERDPEEVLLAAARLSVVEPLCAAVHAAGFEPRVVLPAALATLAAFRLVHGVTGESTLVLAVGARSITLIQAQGAQFAARTGPLGGPDVVTWLTSEITRTVLYFQRQGGLDSPVRLQIASGSAEADALAGALTEKLKLPVNRFEVRSSIELVPAVRDEEVDGSGFALTELVGAAVIQLRPVHPALNLLPPRLRQQESARRRRPGLVAAAGLALLVLLPPVWHFRAVAAEARQRTEAIERELAPVREREARNRVNLRQLDALRQQVEQFQDVASRRDSWLGFLADLQERLGRVEDVWLDRMAITSVPDAPLKLTVSGRMLDRANPLAKVSPETVERVQGLFASLVESPFIVSIEAARFDPSQPGILQFDCVLVADPARPL